MCAIEFLWNSPFKENIFLFLFITFYFGRRREKKKGRLEGEKKNRKHTSERGYLNQSSSQGEWVVDEAAAPEEEDEIRVEDNQKRRNKSVAAPAAVYDSSSFASSSTLLPPLPPSLGLATTKTTHHHYHHHLEQQHTWSFCQCLRRLQTGDTGPRRAQLLKRLHEPNISVHAHIR